MPDELTIELHVPKYGWLTAAVFPCMAVIGLASIAFGRSVGSAIVGGVLLVFFGCLSWLLVAAYRIAGSATPPIHVSADGMTTALWSIAWRDVERVEIGYVKSRPRVKALFILARRPSDVIRPDKLVMRIEAALSARQRGGAVRILQANVDLPLETLASELEAFAGRPLLSAAG